MSTLRTKGLGMGDDTAQVYERYLSVRKTVAVESASQAVESAADAERFPVDMLARIGAPAPPVSARPAEPPGGERKQAAATEKVVLRMLSSLDGRARVCGAAEQLEAARSTYMLCLDELTKQVRGGREHNTTGGVVVEQRGGVHTSSSPFAHWLIAAWVE
jgi:hypothetical protein